MAVDAREVAAVLVACPYVRGLHAGPQGTIMTESAAGRVRGVFVSPQMIVVGLVIGPRVDREQLAARVRAYLAWHAPGVPVTLALAEA